MESCVHDPQSTWPVGVAEADLDGTIRTANPAARRLLRGLSSQGNDATRLPPALMAEAATLRPGASLRRVITTAGAGRVALHLTRGDRTLSLLLLDETPLLQAERQAMAQKARFAALADTVTTGAVFTLDADGRVDGWSRSAAEAERLSAAEAIGLPFDLLLARTHLGLDAAALLAVAARDGQAHVRVDRLSADATQRRVLIEIRAIRGGEGRLDGFLVCLTQPETAQRREAELRRLAETDPLTGVLNRRAFDDEAASACALARAQGVPFAVVALDLDGFKPLNDRYGHAAGDAALRAMADTARRDLRAGDLIGRLGGDEFAIALPGADTALAQRIAERLRQSFTRLRVRHGREHLRFTASFGVAASTLPGESFAQTLARADAALYRAKNAGRDRVAAA